MTTFKDTDLESIIEDLRTLCYSENPYEHRDILLTKRSKKELDKLHELCDTYIYVYEKVLAQGRLN